ncbi:MAG: NUDIX domain-containing protein [Chloroflexi bacterium]|nr:NUDIX domain-containing protein [Chloroflexota bacterium]MBP8054221.1 NUDIX domain-containing protein [Chloroflexota bacterium]
MWHKDSYCSFCGSRFVEEMSWPRTCVHCQQISYKNPLPVAVLLLPVEAGVLAVRRAIEPRLGQLALPGGYIEVGESWQAAAARELREEAGITIDPSTITEYRVRSAPDGTVLIFGLAPRYRLADLPPFTPTPECSEWVILTLPALLAFPLHTEVVTQFLLHPLNFGENMA